MSEAAGKERISVVVPCHNYGRYLAEAVASIAAQSRAADEVVIIDDGSSDDSKAVMDALAAADPRLVTLHRHPARGPAATFNDGVRASSGDLVVILSADDRLSPDYLERLEAELADPGVWFAYAGEHLFGAVEQVRPVRPFDRHRFTRENMVNGSAMMRRSAFDAAGGFREDFDSLGLEDWEFWAHVVELGGRGVPVEGCWLEYRRHPGGSRNDFTPLADLRVHLRLWRLHPRLFRARDVAGWFVESAVPEGLTPPEALPQIRPLSRRPPSTGASIATAGRPEAFGRPGWPRPRPARRAPG